VTEPTAHLVINATLAASRPRLSVLYELDGKTIEAIGSPEAGVRIPGRAVYLGATLLPPDPAQLPPTLTMGLIDDCGRLLLIPPLAKA
jgi:hypothetical protein